MPNGQPEQPEKPAEPMVALSLWQPWATLMCAADPGRDGRPPKEWETRNWYPKNLPPVVALHAAKLIKRADRLAIVDRGRFKDPYAAALERCGYSALDPWAPLYEARLTAEREHAETAGRRIPQALPLGCIVGVGRIAEVRRTEKAAELISMTGVGHMLEIMLGNYAPDRYAWRFADVRPCTAAVPCKGAQQMWLVPPAIAEQVRGQLA